MVMDSVLDMGHIFERHPMASFNIQSTINHRYFP